MHLFKLNAEEESRNKNDLSYFCSLDDTDFCIADENPFASIDLKRTTVSPIVIPSGSILMENNLTDRLRGSRATNETDSNTFYVCRHPHIPKQKKKRVKLIGDLCLWASSKENFLKWHMAMGDPVAAKVTYSIPTPPKYKSELASQGSIEGA